HAGRAEPVAVGVVHVEDQVERPARQPEPRDVDLLELDIGLAERQAPDGGTTANRHPPRPDEMRDAGCGMRNNPRPVTHLASRFPHPEGAAPSTPSRTPSAPSPSSRTRPPSARTSSPLAAPPEDTPAGHRRARR